VHEKFLMKGYRGATMPGGSTEGVFKIAIEGLDVPAQVIEMGEF
jgi:hypothetical protein